jgi:hypothetical protein
LKLYPEIPGIYILIKIGEKSILNDVRPNRVWSSGQTVRRQSWQKQSKMSTPVTWWPPALYDTAFWRRTGSSYEIHRRLQCDRDFMYSRSS